MTWCAYAFAKNFPICRTIELSANLLPESQPEMRNLTVTVDDEVYTQARAWAAQHNTTVSAVVQYTLPTLCTDWRTKAFLAARAANPVLRKPVASPPARSRTDLQRTNCAKINQNEPLFTFARARAAAGCNGSAPGTPFRRGRVWLL